jgi:hypothetical protein
VASRVHIMTDIMSSACLINTYITHLDTYSASSTVLPMWGPPLLYNRNEA